MADTELLPLLHKVAVDVVNIETATAAGKLNPWQAEFLLLDVLEQVGKALATNARRCKRAQHGDAA